MSLRGYGGSLLNKGVNHLSQVGIDADKDWGGVGISDIKEIVAGMNVGDIIFHDGTRIQKLSPGPLGSELITLGIGNNPKWGWVA